MSLSFAQKSIITLLGCLFSLCAVAGDISVEKASVRETAPGQVAAAAYLTLVNHSNTPSILVSASSNVCETIEFHQHLHSNGMMSMRSVAQVTVPANGNMTFEPGGYHIMLIGLSKPLVKGDTVTLVLQFQEGNPVTVLLPVTAILP